MASELNSPLEEFQGRPSFHMAFLVHDLEATRSFYVDVLGCRVGRSTDTWVDLNFFGYQITAHLVSDNVARSTNMRLPDRLFIAAEQPRKYSVGAEKRSPIFNKRESYPWMFSRKT